MRIHCFPAPMRCGGDASGEWALQVELIPTGGVNVENMGDFFAAGAFAVATGGNRVGKALAAAGGFAGIEPNAR